MGEWGVGLLLLGDGVLKVVLVWLDLDSGILVSSEVHLNCRSC